jgi:hypothetical protein
LAGGGWAQGGTHVSNRKNDKNKRRKKNKGKKGLLTPKKKA